MVESGAQVHVLFDTLMLARVEDGKQRMIKWGGEGRFGRCTHILICIHSSAQLEQLRSLELAETHRLLVRVMFAAAPSENDEDLLLNKKIVEKLVKHVMTKCKNFGQYEPQVNDTGELSTKL